MNFLFVSLELVKFALEGRKFLGLLLKGFDPARLLQRKVMHFVNLVLIFLDDFFPPFGLNLLIFEIIITSVSLSLRAREVLVLFHRSLFLFQVLYLFQEFVYNFILVIYNLLLLDVYFVGYRGLNVLISHLWLFRFQRRGRPGFLDHRCKLMFGLLELVLKLLGLLDCTIVAQSPLSRR